jgi:hypothetical protein
MNSPSIKPAAPSTRPALELIALARLSPDVARKNLRALLVANAGHFGNLTGSSFKAILKIEKDTANECISGLGFSPQSQRLQTVVRIKQPTGYSTDDHSSASIEYVRFYLSYDGGRVWQDKGMRAFSVSDAPAERPHDHALGLRIKPREELCFSHTVQRVRAILSWNFPPPPCDPNWTPVWGDVAEADIRFEGPEFILEESIMEAAEVELDEKVSEALRSNNPLEDVVPKELSAADLRVLYGWNSVPEHRYLAPYLSRMLEFTNPEDIAASDARALIESLFEGISDLDLGAVGEKWSNTVADTSYEQLKSVGFDPSTTELAAILQIKQGRGYSGGPCTTGSTEFIAFWIDTGERWEYVGTASVRVHDAGQTPQKGLQYAAVLPIEGLEWAVSTCGGAEPARVRAVLSWNEPPSPIDPYARVVWGNSAEASVLLPTEQFLPAVLEASLLAAEGY